MSLLINPVFRLEGNLQASLEKKKSIANLPSFRSCTMMGTQEDLLMLFFLFPSKLMVADANADLFFF